MNSSLTTLPFEAKLARYLLISSLPPVIILAVSFWYFDVSLYLSTLLILILCSTIGVCAYGLQRKTTYQLRSLANLLTGLAEGDYSMRGIRHQGEDALGELIGQINNLTDMLAKQRYIAHESQLLVTKIIQHIDVAIIAIDQQEHIALLNPAAEKLLSTSQLKALGKPLNDFHASELLSIKKEEIIKLSFSPQPGNYHVIHDHYREQGQQHNLFFITNVHGLLRENERQAWQNLIRVISHEINNSLTPIASLANTLKSQAQKQVLPSVYGDNLNIISARANSLKDFINSYRQLSVLPEPQKSSTDISVLIYKVTGLFPEVIFNISHQIEKELSLDPVQFEQVLINLIKNAHEATLSKNANTKTNIDIHTFQEGDSTIITIKDKGRGLHNSKNLFTPFYSTKKQGSGIGLLLSRQIIEAHGGYLSINNRQDIQGCKVEISLPL